MKISGKLTARITSIAVMLMVAGCSKTETKDQESGDPVDSLANQTQAVNCIKAWSLEEVKANIDSVCYVAILGDETKLTEFPEILGTVPHLESVDARRNNIKSVPGFLSKLKELDLGENGLTECPSGLANLTQLKSLVLDYNSIETLDQAIFNLKTLENLRLYQNRLSEFPIQICSMTNLKVLALGGNSITSIPEEIGNLQNLEILDLSRLGLTELPPDIAKLTNLKTLNLDENQLTTIPEGIKNLKNLEYLFITQNLLTPEEMTKIRSWFGNTVVIQFESAGE